MGKGRRVRTPLKHLPERKTKFLRINLLGEKTLKMSQREAERRPGDTEHRLT